MSIQRRFLHTHTHTHTPPFLAVRDRALSKNATMPASTLRRTPNAHGKKPGLHAATCLTHTKEPSTGPTLPSLLVPALVPLPLRHTAGADLPLPSSALPLTLALALTLARRRVCPTPVHQVGRIPPPNVHSSAGASAHADRLRGPPQVLPAPPVEHLVFAPQLGHAALRLADLLLAAELVVADQALDGGTLARLDPALLGQRHLLGGALALQLRELRRAHAAGRVEGRAVYRGWRRDGPRGLLLGLLALLLREGLWRRRHWVREAAVVRWLLRLGRRMRLERLLVRGRPDGGVWRRAQHLTLW